MVKRNDLIDTIKNCYFKYNGIIDSEFNLFGIIDETNQDQDIWNDYIGCYKPNTNELFLSNATCNPGKSCTLNKEGGAAHLCVGFHKNGWVIEIHKKSSPSFAHEAFCQRPEYNTLPIKIWRDINKNYIFDKSIDYTQVGNWFGINIHRASILQDVPKIGDYSWGCQVFNNHADLEQYLIWAKDTQKYKNNNKCLFSYLLINKNDINAIL